MNIYQQKPTQAFIFASWAVLIVGISAYLIGLWNAEIELTERGYHLTLIFYGLFSAISLQKSVRDRHEGIPVTDVYFGLSWVSTIIAIMLLVLALWNADMWLSEKGFYAMAYTMSLFAAIAVQKNTRDIAAINQDTRLGQSQKEKNRRGQETHSAQEPFQTESTKG
ncbi:MAG: inner membrane protein YiaA [Chloroflexota bacterium]